MRQLHLMEIETLIYIDLSWLFRGSIARMDMWSSVLTEEQILSLRYKKNFLKIKALCFACLKNLLIELCSYSTKPN